MSARTKYINTTTARMFSILFYCIILFIIGHLKVAEIKIQKKSTHIRQNITFIQTHFELFSFHFMTTRSFDLRSALPARQCNTPLYNRVAGQVEVPVGQLNLSDIFPHSANNVLEPILHPDIGPIN